MPDNSPDRLRTHPRERLAATVQHLSLIDQATRLRTEPHAPVGGHRQVALMRRGAVSVILFVFDDGGYIREHSAPGEVLVQVLAGHLVIGVNDEDIHVRTGELLSLAPGVTHSVRALATTDMVLTISQVGSRDSGP